MNESVFSKYDVVSTSHYSVWWKSFSEVSQMNYSPFPLALINYFIHLKNADPMAMLLFSDYFSCVLPGSPIRL